MNRIRLCSSSDPISLVRSLPLLLSSDDSADLLHRETTRVPSNVPRALSIPYEASSASEEGFRYLFWQDMMDMSSVM
jgi:hypothetical protein